MLPLDVSLGSDPNLTSNEIDIPSIEKTTSRFHNLHEIVKRRMFVAHALEPMYSLKKKKDCVNVSNLKRFIEKDTAFGDAKKSVVSTCGEPAPKGVMGTPAGTGITRQTRRREQSKVTAGLRPELSTCTRVQSQKAHIPVSKAMGSKVLGATEPSSTVIGGHRLRDQSHLRSPMN
ncbi:hypothetical protein GHT06_020540 [Daphnia sinensis]|uniref:Uncharacterized protein n=1 Tax=Daphnia sinensis TaxID=1820382 RepID=A0AAD5KJ76_9CRUS|nr:hypothetical protein GHT06_020540 [Daphnia sinensis]